MKAIISNIDDRVLFSYHLINIKEKIKEIENFDNPEVINIVENLRIQSLIKTIEEFSSISVIYSQLAYVLYKKIRDNYSLSYLIRNFKFSFTFEEFNEEVRQYYESYLKATVKHKVSPVEYYQFVVEKNFEEHSEIGRTLHYSDNSVLRFLKSGEVILFPLEELLEIHLIKGMYQSMGRIELIDNNPSVINFKRNYVRWGGVGKEDYCESDKYSFSPDALQLTELI